MIPPQALTSLVGLTVGDAFGETFFVADPSYRIPARELLEPPWRWTDDTAMALGIVEVLATAGRVDPDALARVFARNYAREPRRGYGGTAHEILTDIGRGLRWRDVAGAVFDGQGSMGNGAAMRVAPVGAWFADDLDRVVTEALASAEPTHAHPDGAAGAIAVAVATAVACNKGNADAIWDAVLARTPDGPTRTGIVTPRAACPPTRRSEPPRRSSGRAVA